MAWPPKPQPGDLPWDLSPNLEAIEDFLDNLPAEIANPETDIGGAVASAAGGGGGGGGDVPAATTTVAGKVELATNAETQAGSDGTRAVTPAGLSSRTATTSRTGLAEIATQDEAKTGSDTTRIVTPAALKSVLDDRAKKYANVVVWNGSSYPARTSGVTNIFFGPQNPGLLMAAGDYWANPAATTLDTVVAAAENTGSNLFAAIQAAVAANPIGFGAGQLQPAAGGSLDLTVLGSSPNRVVGWKMPDGSVSRVYATLFVPYGWTDLRVRLYWMHNTSSPSGGVTWVCNVTPFNTGSTITGGTADTSTQSVASQGVPKAFAFSGSNPVTPGQPVAITIARNGTAGSDTFTGDAYVLGIKVERTV